MFASLAAEASCGQPSSSFHRVSASLPGVFGVEWGSLRTCQPESKPGNTSVNAEASPPQAEGEQAAGAAELDAAWLPPPLPLEAKKVPMAHLAACEVFAADLLQLAAQLCCNQVHGFGHTPDAPVCDVEQIHLLLGCSIASPLDFKAWLELYDQGQAPLLSIENGTSKNCTAFVSNLSAGAVRGCCLRRKCTGGYNGPDLTISEVQCFLTHPEPKGPSKGGFCTPGAT